MVHMPAAATHPAAQPACLPPRARPPAARPDLLPKPYLDALSELQDRLPSFPSSIAFEVRPALAGCRAGAEAAAGAQAGLPRSHGAAVGRCLAAAAPLVSMSQAHAPPLIYICVFSPRPLITQVIQEELGRPVHEVFSEITPEPVAAASLGQVGSGGLLTSAAPCRPRPLEVAKGRSTAWQEQLTPSLPRPRPAPQVYKARLRSTGEEVAVKVQRPGIGEGIAVDMVLLRRLVQVVDDNIPQVRALHLPPCPAAGGL